MRFLHAWVTDFAWAPQLTHRLQFHSARLKDTDTKLRYTAILETKSQTAISAILALKQKLEVSTIHVTPYPLRGKGGSVTLIG